MKKKPQNENIKELQQLENLDFHNELKKSIEYENTVDEVNLKQINELLMFARYNGWYPTITKQFDDEVTEEALEIYESIFNVKKDELIWQYLILVKEINILKDLGMEEKEFLTFKNKVNEFKDIL